MRINEIIMALMGPSNNNTAYVTDRGVHGTLYYYEVKEVTSFKDHVVIVIDKNFPHTVDEI